MKTSALQVVKLHGCGGVKRAVGEMLWLLWAFLGRLLAVLCEERMAYKTRGRKFMPDGVGIGRQYPMPNARVV